MCLADERLKDLRNRCYRELSGGQQQRVLLARTLCAAQEMLLLDEPVAGLDPVAAEEMYEIVQELNRDGMTILMVTHDLGAPEKYASCVFHLLGGGEYRFSRKEGRA